MLTVWQHEHLTCLPPDGYESRRLQEPQTIWAKPVHTAFLVRLNKLIPNFVFCQMRIVKIPLCNIAIPLP